MRKSMIKKSCGAFLDMSRAEIYNCGFKISDFINGRGIDKSIETELIRIEVGRNLIGWDSIGWYSNAVKSMSIYLIEGNILIFSLIGNTIQWNHKTPKEMRTYLKEILNIPINFKEYKDMLELEQQRDKYQKESDKLHDIFKGIK